MAVSLPDLADLVGDLERRVAGLEAYVKSNDGRITELEGRARTAIQGLRAGLDRERWRAKYGRNR